MNPFLQDSYGHAKPSDGVTWQGQLQPDADIIDAYGQTHAADYGGVEYAGWHNLRLRVVFTANVTAHRADLLRRLQYPDDVDVVAGKYSVSELTAIRNAIDREYGQLHVMLLGFGFQYLRVGLAPGMEAAAYRLAAEYGSALALSVGALPVVPPGCGPPPKPVPCPRPPRPAPASAGLSLRLVDVTRTIAPWQQGSATLVVRNDGSRTFRMDTGEPITGSLYALGTARPVGIWVGAVAGVGYGLNLAPGEQGTVRVLFGAAACASRSSAVPPGPYGLRVELEPESNPDTPRYLSPEAPVTVS